MAPAMHPSVSQSPPSEMASRTADSKSVASRKATIAGGTVPAHDESKTYVGRMPSRVNEVTVDPPLDLLPQVPLRRAGPGQEDRRCGRPCALHALGVVVGDAGRLLGPVQHLVERAERPRGRADPHRRAVAPAAV